MARPLAGPRLPDLTLPAAPNGVPVALRTTRREGTVLLVPHAGDCPDCLAYVDLLGAVQAELRDWDGRVLVVVPESLESATAASERLRTPFAVLADPEGVCATRCGVAPGSMIIADQWGEIFHVHAGMPEAHAFPPPEEVVEWLRFVAIQCPECQGEAW